MTDKEINELYILRELQADKTRPMSREEFNRMAELAEKYWIELNGKSRSQKTESGKIARAKINTRASREIPNSRV